jgi:TM2 domain-containing membrane protein YozV
MFCTKCGSPNGDAASFCVKCGAPLAAAGAPRNTASQNATPDSATVRGQTAAAPKTVTGKNPVVALILSVFLGALGAGQFYNGDWKKGLAMALASLLLGVATAGLVTFGVWIWSMIDAYQVASGKWSTW